MTITQEQVAAKLREHASNGCWDVCEDDLVEAADMLEQLAAERDPMKDPRVRALVDATLDLLALQTSSRNKIYRKVCAALRDLEQGDT